MAGAGRQDKALSPDPLIMASAARQDKIFYFELPLHLTRLGKQIDKKACNEVCDRLAKDLNAFQSYVSDVFPFVHIEKVSKASNKQSIVLDYAVYSVEELDSFFECAKVQDGNNLSACIGQYYEKWLYETGRVHSKQIDFKTFMPEHVYQTGKLKPHQHYDMDLRDSQIGKRGFEGNTRYKTGHKTGQSKEVEILRKKIMVHIPDRQNYYSGITSVAMKSDCEEYNNIEFTKLGNSDIYTAFVNVPLSDVNHVKYKYEVKGFKLSTVQSSINYFTLNSLKTQRDIWHGFEYECICAHLKDIFRTYSSNVDITAGVSEVEILCLGYTIKYQAHRKSLVNELFINKPLVSSTSYVLLIIALGILLENYTDLCYDRQISSNQACTLLEELRKHKLKKLSCTNELNVVSVCEIFCKIALQDRFCPLSMMVKCFPFLEEGFLIEYVNFQTKQHVEIAHETDVTKHESVTLCLNMYETHLQKISNEENESIDAKKLLELLLEHLPFNLAFSAFKVISESRKAPISPLEEQLYHDSLKILKKKVLIEITTANRTAESSRIFLLWTAVSQLSLLREEMKVTFESEIVNTIKSESILKRNVPKFVESLSAQKDLFVDMPEQKSVLQALLESPRPDLHKAYKSVLDLPRFENHANENINEYSHKWLNKLITHAKQNVVILYEEFADLMSLKVVAKQPEIHQALEELVINELQEIGILNALRKLERMEEKAEMWLCKHLEVLIAKKCRGQKPMDILRAVCPGDGVRINSRVVATVICSLLNVHFYVKEGQNLIEQFADMVKDFQFWLTIFSSTGEKVGIVHDNSHYQNAKQCLEKMVLALKTHDVPFGYIDDLEMLCKDGIRRLLSFGGCKREDLDKWQNEANLRFMEETKRLANVEIVMKETKRHILKYFPDGCKCLIDYIEQLLVWTDKSGKRLTNGKYTARDLESEKGMWIDMKKVPEICKGLEPLVDSKVFWNMCTVLVCEEYLQNEDKMSDDIDDHNQPVGKVVGRESDHLMKMSVSRFMTILSSTGVKSYTDMWNEIQTNNTMQMTGIFAMFKGCFKQIEREIQIAETFLKIPIQRDTKITLERISQIKEVEHTFEAIKMALIVFKINIDSDEDKIVHDAVASFEKLQDKKNLSITFHDVTTALETVFIIAKKLSKESIEILHSIGHSSSLLEFLENIVDDDIRNLIDAVEDISEQHVSESTVSGLIEIKRFLNPLLQCNFERKGDILFHVVEEQTILHTSIAKSLPNKIDECMNNLHNLKSLYNNVANRGEQTKETIANILNKGVFQFSLVGDRSSCDFMAVYNQESSSVSVSRSKVSLTDLRSRALLLMNTEWNESEQRLKKGDLEKFVTNVDVCLEIAENAFQLHSSGHMNFITFGRSEKPSKLKELKDDLHKQLCSWQSSLSSERVCHYLMNFVQGKQIHTLSNYLENDMEKEAVNTLLKYIHPDMKIDNLRNAYLQEKENYTDWDEKHMLFCMGKSLHYIYKDLLLYQRIITIEEEQETRITDVVHNGRLLVAHLEESSLLVVKTVLALFANTIPPRLPEANRVLFCTRDTTWSELQLLLDRCLMAYRFYGKHTIFCIANVEMLPNEIQFKLVEDLRHLHEKKDFLLAIVCRGSKSHPFIDQLSDCVTTIRPSTDKIVRDIFAMECPDVCTFTSEVAGLGKTNTIRKKAHKKQKTLIEFHISGPLRKRLLVERLQDLNINSNHQLHINIGTVDNYVELDTFLFELIILRHVTSGTLSVCLPTLHISIEIANTIHDTLRNSLQTAMLFKRKHLIWNDYYDFSVSREIQSSVQVVCNFIYCLEKGCLDNTDLMFSGSSAVSPISTKRCRSLMKKYLHTTSGMSFAVVNIFVNVLADQLKKMSCSAFFKTSRIRDMIGYKTAPTIKSTLVKALVEVSREFSSRSVQSCRTSQASAVASNKKILDDTASTVKNLAEGSIKRLEGMIQWEESNHLIYVFHNQNIQTISPMYRELSKVPEHIKTLFEGQMKKEMQDFKFLDQSQLQTILQKIARTDPFPLPSEKLKKLASEYALTPDNLLKMVLIMLRIKSNIPVIVMGETGCGKTSLISYLADICEAPFEIMNIHAGVEEHDILERLKKTNEEALGALSVSTWLFLDEINTCEHIGLISDIICHHRCSGKVLAPNLVVMGACNPYKLRSSLAISTAGLEGKEKTDELSRLVYRVLPLPEMLVDYVWDFGSLNQNDEAIYIKRMVEDVFPGNQKHNKLLTDLLSMSQQFVRDKENTTYSVSLRDVYRCKTLTLWFLKTLEQKNVYSSNKMKDVQEISMKAIILSLAHCYHSRFSAIDVRRDYMSSIATIFFMNEHTSYNKERIRSVIIEEQTDYLNRMELPPGTAKNTALQENVFVILVCILNRIPIFVVGKPGCSKSLAMQIIRSNLRGKDSKDEFFKTLPQLYCVSFQGSESSTSDGIIKVFDKAEKYQHTNNTDEVLSVVILDEIGLAEISRFNPLKVLHNLLEPDRKLRPNVAVVGISNWSLDASKMNRAIHLSRPDMDVVELHETGKSISKSFEKEEDKSLFGNFNMSHTFSTTDIEDELKGIAESYFLYTKTLRFKNFHGLRDYYSLVKYIARELSETETKLSEEERSGVIMMGLERNFGGLPSEKETLLRHFKIHLKNLTITQIPVVDLITNNIRDQMARHLMLITTGESVLGIVEEQLSKLGRDKKEVIFGSQFEEDLTDDYNYRILSRIILCMEQGLVLILKDLENIYGSLYDMLNQNYTIIGKKKNCRVALGPYSNPICHVADTFRCIVLVDESKIDYTDPPFLNRFEKQYLRFADITSNEQKDVIAILEDWIEDLCSIKDKYFTKVDTFPIYSEDMVASLILKFNKELETYTSSKTRDKFILKCKAELLWIIKPEAVVRLSKSDDTQTQNESETIKEQFFELPVHSGMNAFMRYQLDELLDSTICDKAGLMTIVFTNSNIHTKALHHVSVRKTQVDKLGAFKSEKQLSLRMQNFWMDSDAEVLFVQCSAIDDEKHIMLAKSVIERHRVEFQAKSLKMAKHVYLVIHMDRSKGTSRIVSQINFLSGWKLVMLDCLEPPTTPLPHLCSLTLFETIARKRPLHDYIGEQLFWTFTRIKYTSQGRNVESINHILNEMKQSTEFLEVLDGQICSWISTHNPDIHDKEWQVNIACDSQALQTSATFVDALEKHILSVINVPLSKTVYQMEVVNILDSFFVKDSCSDQRKRSWKAMLENGRIFSINKVPTESGPETYSCESKDLGLKMPFSAFLFESIESTRDEFLDSLTFLKSEFDIDERDELPLEIFNALVFKQERFILQKTPNVTEYLYENWSDDYIDDFCNIVSFTVCSTLPVEKRVQYMKWAISQNTALSFKDPSELFARLHSTFWAYSSLFNAELQLLGMCRDVLFVDGNDLIELLFVKGAADDKDSGVKQIMLQNDTHISPSKEQQVYEPFTDEKEEMTETSHKQRNDSMLSSNTSENDNTVFIDQTQIDRSIVSLEGTDTGISSSQTHGSAIDLTGITLEIADCDDKTSKRSSNSSSTNEDNIDKVDTSKTDTYSEIERDKTVKSMSDKSNMSKHDNLVDMVCMKMLPTSDTLRRYNGVLTWQSRVNNVLTLASQVSQKLKSIEALRLCNDVTTELIVPFSLNDSFLCVIGQLLQNSCDLDSELIFQAVMNIIEMAPSIEQSKCQKTLSSYFTRCLKCSMTKALDYLLELVKNSTLPDNNCSHLKSTMQWALMLEEDKNETVFMDLLTYNCDEKESTCTDEDDTNNDNEADDRGDGDDDQGKIEVIEEVEAEDEEVAKEKNEREDEKEDNLKEENYLENDYEDNDADEDDEDEGIKEEEEQKQIEVDEKDEDQENEEEDEEEQGAEKDDNEKQESEFLSKLDHCLKQMYQNDAGDSPFIVMLVDLMEDMYMQSFEDEEHSSESEEHSSESDNVTQLLVCHKILTETDFGIRYIAALAYFKAFIQSLKPVIEDGMATSSCITAINAIFGNTGEHSVSTSMLKYFLKVVGMDKVFSRLVKTCGNLKKHLTFLKKDFWKESYIHDCFEACPLSVYVPSIVEDIEGLFSNTQDSKTILYRLKQLAEKAKQSIDGMILLYSVALKHFYISSSCMKMTDTMSTQASILLEEVICTSPKRPQLKMLKCLLGKDDFRVPEFLHGEETDSKHIAINSFLSSLYGLLLANDNFASSDMLPVLTRCLLKPLSVRECYLPGFPNSHSQTSSVFDVDSPLSAVSYMTCQCGYRLAIRGRVNSCTICKTDLNHMDPIHSGVLESECETGYVTCTEMKSVYFGVREMSPVTCSVLYILIKGCLLGSLALDLTPAMSLEEVTSITDKVVSETLWQDIECHWNNLSKLLNVSDNVVGMFLHTILRHTRVQLCEQSNDMHSIQAREEWEKQFSSSVNTIMDQRFQMMHLIDEAHTRIQGLAKCTIEKSVYELDDLSNMPPRDRTAILPSLFRMRSVPTMENFVSEIQAFKKENPFLLLILKNNQNLKLPIHIFNIVQWCIATASNINYMMKKHECLEMTVTDFIYKRCEEKKDILKKRFDAFQQSWEILVKSGHFDYISRIHARSKMSEVLFIGTDSIVYQVLGHLVGIQNAFLEKALQLSSNCNALYFLSRDEHMSVMPCIPAAEIRKQHLIQFDFQPNGSNYAINFDTDILQHSQCGLSYGLGRLIIYDFNRMEKDLASDIIVGKYYINLENALPSITFTDELYRNYVSLVNVLKKEVSQKQLPSDIELKVIAQKENNPSMTTELLTHLGVIMTLLKKTKDPNPEKALIDYVEEWKVLLTRKMPDNLLPNPQNCVKLCHVVALHELLEELNSEPIIDALEENFRSEFDTGLDDHFKKLTDKHYEHAKLLLKAIRRFIHRCLSIRDADPERTLLSYLSDESFWPEDVVKEKHIVHGQVVVKMVDVLPETLLVRHVHATVMVIKTAVEREQKPDVGLSDIALLALKAKTNATPARKAERKKKTKKALMKS